MIRKPAIAQRLKTRHLLLLVQLEEAKSILRAAEAVGMTQPAASKLLVEVEALLEAPLFVRHPRGVVPTQFGKVVIKHARKALAELAQAEEEIVALREGMVGEVSIGCVMTSAMSLVPRAVAKLNQRSPKVVVSIDVDFSEQLVERVLAGTLDIAVARIHNRPQLAGAFFEPLNEIPHGIFVRVGHPLTRARTPDLATLAKQSWVLPAPGNVLRDRLTVMFAEHGLQLPNQGVETSSVSVVASLLQCTDMVTMIADEVMQAEVARKVLVRLPVDLAIRLGPVGIVTRGEDTLSPVARAMLAALRDVVSAERRAAKPPND